MKAPSKAFFISIKTFAWAIAFLICSFVLRDYENLMNGEKGLDFNGYQWITSHKTNLLNEGPIGYGILGLLSLCGGMFVKEIVSLQNYLFKIVYGSRSNSFSPIKGVKTNNENC
jgi:hypothetical protein